MKPNDLTPIALLNVREYAKRAAKIGLTPFASPSQIKAVRVGDRVKVHGCGGCWLVVAIESREGKKRFTGEIVDFGNVPTLLGGTRIIFHACNIAAVVEFDVDTYSWQPIPTSPQPTNTIHTHEGETKQ
jgi:hypothetical protein